MRFLNWIGFILTIGVLLYFLFKSFYGLYLAFTHTYTGGPWQCADNLSAPIRLNTKAEVQCMSIDGINCLGGDCTTNLKKNQSEIDPVTCKTENYAKSDHICSKARSFLLDV